MRKSILLVSVILLAALALAQAPPPSTNASQFQVSLNFLGGQSSALSTAATSQFTTNIALRGDVIAMPGAGYTGYLGGAQYNLCGVAAIEGFLATTSLSCGKIMPYVDGALGLGRVQQNGVSTQSIAGLARFGMNYDPSGTGRFTVNLFEAGWGHFGPPMVGQSANAWFYQTGLAVGLGTHSAATQAKKARMSRASKKKLDRLNAEIGKAQQN